MTKIIVFISLGAVLIYLFFFRKTYAADEQVADVNPIEAANANLLTTGRVAAAGQKYLNSLLGNVEIAGQSVPATLPFAAVGLYSAYVHENFDPRLAATINPVIELPYQSYKVVTTAAKETAENVKNNPVIYANPVIGGADFGLQSAKNVIEKIFGGSGGEIRSILSRIS